MTLADAGYKQRAVKPRSPGPTKRKEGLDRRGEVGIDFVRPPATALATVRAPGPDCNPPASLATGI